MSIKFAYQSELDVNIQLQNEYESKSQNFENKYSDFEDSQQMDNNDEQFEDIPQHQFSPQKVNNDNYIQTMMILEQEGFFDKENINEIPICQIKHDLHQSQLLSRRIIYRIDSASDSVSAITLKLIDLFLEKDHTSKISKKCYFNILYDLHKI